MKTVLIIGVGQFGSHIAKRMAELRCEVMAVDLNEDRINEILPYVTNARIGDSTNEDFLRSLGVDNYDVCIVALGGLFQSSLETTSLLSELGAKQIISRATNDVQMKFLLRNGADEVVYPEKQMALRIATKYASDSILDFIQLDNNYSIYEMKVPKEWYGKTLSQIDVRKKYKVNILTVKRKREVFIPSFDTVMQTDDIVFAIGEIRDIQRCFRI
ncbi:MAG: TrkA family potassium uptake protein [Clostridia bacterium]|jgi:trk system potassium uptake protein TrkA|nr:TrkA family potassium uptake protein [Clostridia bacterium]MBQ1554071.1 TrkA family potassium uptake protein [Clostridia bacterium]MBQ4396514.1 TrkA family potassium uptake protein [Clostridia bacterium]MBQ5544843.1 TrkA family potassium uptake protein [Clostridia bacterium]